MATKSKTKVRKSPMKEPSPFFTPKNSANTLPKQTPKEARDQSILPPSINSPNRDLEELEGNLLTTDKMKEILKNFQSEFLAEIKNQIMENAKSIREVNKRSADLEDKFDKLIIDHNMLLEQSSKMASQITILNDQMNRMEDKSRKNNLRIRGISEKINIEDLPTYIMEMFSKITPNFSHLDQKLDTVHRIPLPSHLQNRSSRDVIVRIHHLSTKEAISKASYIKKTFEHPYESIQIYADLSKNTINKRKEFNSITQGLRKSNLAYKWTFPVGLLVLQGSSWHKIKSPVEGENFLRSINTPDPKELLMELQAPMPDWQRMK